MGKWSTIYCGLYRIQYNLLSDNLFKIIFCLVCFIGPIIIRTFHILISYKALFIHALWISRSIHPVFLVWYSEWYSDPDLIGVLGFSSMAREDLVTYYRFIFGSSRIRRLLTTQNFVLIVHYKASSVVDINILNKFLH